jgi:predicted nucleotidyltransferase
VVERSEIEDLAGRIAKEFKPERIILFGSYASGAPSPDSDVDLLVVLPHQGKSWRVAAEIRKRARSPFPMDLIVRTPEQIRARMALDDPFVREIVERGQVLYEAARG